jgi:hypothetical protein
VRDSLFRRNIFFRLAAAVEGGAGELEGGALDPRQPRRHPLPPTPRPAAGAPGSAAHAACGAVFPNAEAQGRVPGLRLFVFLFCLFYLLFIVCGRGRPLDQLRDQRGQRRRYWPPFAPWVQ